jgi:hypothetical protein
MNKWRGFAPMEASIYEVLSASRAVKNSAANIVTAL